MMKVQRMTDMGEMDNGYVARGVSVLLASQGVRLGSQLVGLIVLSRLLGPEAFGFAAVAILIVGIGEVLRDAGLGSAIVREVHLSRVQRDSLFWVSLALGGALAFALLAAAGLIAHLFSMPQLTPALRCLSAVFVANAIAMPYRAMHNRSGNFNAIAAADAIAAALGLGAAVGTAVLGVGFWALIIQLLVSSGAGLLVLVSFGRWIPGWYRRGSGIGRILKFGGHLLFSQVVSYLGNRADIVTLGLVGTPTSLGYYSRAYQVSVTTVEQVKAPTLSVALSALARRNDQVEQSRFLLSAQTMVVMATIPVLAVLAGLAPQVVQIVLGPEWVDAAPLVAILAIGSAFQQAAGTAAWIMISGGHGPALRNYSLMSTTLKVVLVLALSPLGALGVACGFTLAVIVSYPIAILMARRAGVIPVASLVLQASRTLGVGAIAALAGSIVASQMSAMSALPVFIVGALAVVAVFAFAALVIRGVRRDLVLFFRAIALIVKGK